MKKVINITLGGIVFAIEQEAYDALSIYLERIKGALLEGDDTAEIIGDVENAIAEKFIARKRSEKIAVTAADAQAVIEELGTPADFGQETATTDEGTTTHAEHTETKKRLYRDVDDVVVAGVASGLAKYFDIDPVIVRIIFFISIFFNGLGLFIYIVLWLVVPKAQTTAEKYAMRGEKVTIKEITQRVKKNLKKSSEVKVVSEGTWSTVRSICVNIFNVVGIMARGLLEIGRYVFGIAFVLGGALGLAGLVTLYSVVLLSDKALFPYDAQIALHTMLGSGIGVIAIIASFVMLMIPLQVIIMAGASLLAQKNYFSVTKVVSLIVVWIVAVIVAVTTSLLQVEQVMQQVDPEGLEQGRYEMLIDADEGTVRIDTDTVSVKNIPGGIEIYDGVSVSERSTSVDLSGKGLTGSLKGEVRHLQNLTSLNVSNNQFTGLPAEVGQLTKLEVLNLSNNQFTGLPHELGNLQNLKVLDLRGNDISTFDLEYIQNQLPASTVVYRD